MIAANRIKFQKIFSNELNIPDLIMDVAFDSDDSEISTFLNREAVSSESYDGRYNNTVHYKYSERFAPRFTFIKKNFEDFDSSEVRAVLKWLTSADEPSLLDVYYDDSNVVEWSAIGGWTEIVTYKLANRRTAAVVATFESIMPFALSDLYTITKQISDAQDNKITIEIDTDDNKPIYPRVTINHGYGVITTPHSIVAIPSTVSFTDIFDMTDYVENTVYYNGTTYYWKTSENTFCSSDALPPYEGWTVVEATRAYTEEDVFEPNTFYYYDGMYYWIDPNSFHSSANLPIDISTTSVKLTNTHYDVWGQPTPLSSVVVKNNVSTETVTLDGVNKIVNSSNVKRIYGDDFNWQWLELRDGKNEITVLGNCEVKIEYREIRKVGEF